MHLLVLNQFLITLNKEVLTMKNSEWDLRVDQIVKDTKNAYDRREKKLKKILKEAERAEDVYVIGRIHHLLSLCYFDLGSRNKILPHAVKAVDIFEKLNDKRMLARSYNLLGIAYLAQGNYLRAKKARHSQGCHAE